MSEMILTWGAISMADDSRQPSVRLDGRFRWPSIIRMPGSPDATHD